MFDVKKLESLERLIKSLSDMKNESFKFKDWLQFSGDAKNSVELLNEMRELNKPKPVPSMAVESPSIEVINPDTPKKKAKK